MVRRQRPHTPSTVRANTAPILDRKLRTISVFGLALALALATAGRAAPQTGASIRYEAILQWTGTHFETIHAAGVQQETDSPVVDIPFQQPRAVAARLHSSRDVVYVLDAGNNRIQVFEANAAFRSLSHADLTFTAGVPTAGEFNDQTIRPVEWAAVADKWICPNSEAVFVNGVAWTRVDDLTGFVADDQVYLVDYTAATNQPEFNLPAGSLESTSLLEIRYLVTDLQDYGGGTPVPGLGDVDYGVHSGSTAYTKVQIDETSGGPASWQSPMALAVIDDPTDTTIDQLFVTDAADNSGAGSEQLFSFTITEPGVVAAGESYDDLLAGPYGVAAAERDAGAGASAWLSADTGPFDRASYPFVVDANQVTGHTYTITVDTGVVTITDDMTGRVLVNAGAEAAFADPFLGIPGLSLDLNAGPWGDSSTTLTTTRAYPGRFLFVSDTGNDRLKVIGLVSDATAAGSNWSGDWLPIDARVGAAQPSGAGTIGATAGIDYRQTTPASVGEDWIAWTTAFPIAEGTLGTITFDPGGAADTWLRIDDLSTAAAEDSVYQVDWENGMIVFGDGIHGAIPPATTEFEYDYAVSPDILRYSSSGTGLGRFTSPRGLAARWNATLQRFDLYVADTANQRVQKLSFFPADTTLHVAARIETVTSWTQAASASDVLSGPSDVEVEVDGDGTVFVAVADPGNHRIAIFRDNDADEPGSTAAPAFDSSLGKLGNQLGTFVSPIGVQFLGNGGNLDLYVADPERDVVTKYEEGPTPTITLLYTGDSELPACFPPNGAYPIRFTTTHPPLGGWVDFYFDTTAEFDETTARLAVAAGTTSPTAGLAYWNFANTPGGVPPDGDYYLFALLRDANGVTVATDQSTDGLEICIDSSLIPALLARDAIDLDRTLYLQNGLNRDVVLQVIFPDSLVGVAFSGSFDPTLLQVLSATPGTVWEGTGYTNQLFSATIDPVAGTFRVVSSVLGAPAGLSGSGPYTVAFLQVRTNANALNGTQRFRDGVISLSKATSAMVDVHGDPPPAWATRSLRVRAAYLGDIATTGAGADSLVPHLQPRPDGRIDFEDQIAFTLGWNGDTFVRDRIADMGPATGTSPGLWPVPDAAWDIDDLVVFTSQASYASAAGWNTAAFQLPFQVGPLGSAAGGGAAGAFGTSSSPVRTELVKTSTGVDLVVTAHSEHPLFGAHLVVEFDPHGWNLVHIQSARLFASSGGDELAIPILGPGHGEIGLTRLSTQNPAVSGNGELARFHFETGEAASGNTDLRLTFDLRGAGNQHLGTGTEIVGAEPRPETPSLPTQLTLDPAQPNPARPGVRIGFALPQDSGVQLAIYDASGRRVRLLENGNRTAGTHLVAWDGKNDERLDVPSGIYFYELRVGSRQLERKLVLVR